MGYSTFLNIASWILIGLAYLLYTVFLPYYLQSRGASTGDGSTYTTYRSYAIVNVCSMFGPMIAGCLVEVRFLGRRYTMYYMPTPRKSFHQPIGVRAMH